MRGGSTKQKERFELPKLVELGAEATRRQAVRL